MPKGTKEDDRAFFGNEVSYDVVKQHPYDFERNFQTYNK